MSTLTPSQKQAFQRQYNKFKNRYWRYGNEDHQDVLPCKRVHKAYAKQYKVLGKMYSPAQITWILDHNCFPPIQDENGVKLEFSHQCCPNKKSKSTTNYPYQTQDSSERDVNPCIETSHIIFEQHPENMTRRNCHLNLKKYIQSKTSNRYTKDEDKIKPGPFFIKNIPFEMRLHGINFKNKNKKNNNKPKRKYQQRIRRSYRLKRKANNKKANNSIFKIKCDHINKCFMNIKRL